MNPQSPALRSDKVLNLLVLYDGQSTPIGTVRDYLDSFRLYSKHRVFYACATRDSICNIDLNIFDAIIVHYSVRLIYPDFIAASYAKALVDYKGHKVLFIQDDYQNTEVARIWIELIGFQTIFSIIPEDCIASVYPPHRFPNTQFRCILTGYVPDKLKNWPTAKALYKRPVRIGYRGRRLPYWLGHRGQEKYTVGAYMKKICEQRKISHDIECHDDKRIYGDDWFHFLANCKATLGSISGSNVFDDTGIIDKAIQIAMRVNPNLTYEEAYAVYVAPHEGKTQYGPVDIDVISPKIFEAITLKTALIMFPGRYSDVVKPDVHYIPLETDFSNIDEVLEKACNDDYLAALTERAYEDIVLSGKYSYQQFVSEMDAYFSQAVKQSLGYIPICGTSGYFNSETGSDTIFDTHFTTNKVTTVALTKSVYQPQNTDILPGTVPIETMYGYHNPNQARDILFDTAPKISKEKETANVVLLEDVTQHKRKKSLLGSVKKEINRFVTRMSRKLSPANAAPR